MAEPSTDADVHRDIMRMDRQHREATEQQYRDSHFEASNKPSEYHHTDVGNARRLVKKYGKDLRYCFPWRTWLIYDGKRWRADDTGRIYQLAKKTLEEMFAESFDDKELQKHVRISQNRSRLEAMITLARDEVPILPAELDRDPMLLNCTNGTLDLHIGKLHKHDRSNYCTKLCPTAYIETPLDNEKRQLWENFLRETFQDDQQIISWLQRWFGYCLTGSSTEHLLPIFWGTGANGKTTLLDATLHAMGEDFAMQAPPNFLIQKSGDTHPTELAQLFGKRFVVCSETGDGRKLAEALVKSLTGGEKIQARFCHKDFFGFDATHKIVLATNHKPNITGTDHGIWRRLRLVPFNVTIPDEMQDRQLPAKLRQAATAILSWMVEGCLAWERQGLAAPDSISRATQSYRMEEDITRRFLDERCLIGEAYTCRASMFYEAYQKWCQAEGETPASQRKFGASLTEKGFERYSNNGTCYRGIGLLTEGMDQNANSAIDCSTAIYENPTEGTEGTE